MLYRKLFLIVFMAIFIFNVFSLDIEDLSGKKYRYNDPIVEQDITFFSKTFYYENRKNGSGSVTMDTSMVCKYRLENKYGIDYIAFGDDYENKWLILYNDNFILLFDSEGPPFFAGYSVLKKEYHLFVFDPESLDYYKSRAEFSTSSELTENIGNKEIRYPAENLSNWRIPFPWVEGVNGNGTGERISTWDIPEKRDQIISSLFISNGYVSYDRPDLYRKNARVKKIRIHDIKSGKVYDFDLEDTPNYQEIDFLPIATGGEITIEILEVYPGTTYEDTCINQMEYFIDY